MRGTRTLLCAAVLAALVPAGRGQLARAAENPPPKTVRIPGTTAPAPSKPAVASVTTERGPGWVRSDITLDGPLRDTLRLSTGVSVPPGSRKFSLAFLVGSGDASAGVADAPASGGAAACAPRPSSGPAQGGPGHVLVWDPAAPGKLALRADRIPAGARLAATDLDGDGTAELLALSEGEILAIRGAGTDPAPLVSDPALGTPDRRSPPLGDPDDLAFRLAVTGSLRAYGRQTPDPGAASDADHAAPAAGTGWGLLSETPLPVSAVRRDESIALSSPVIRRIPGGGGRFVTSPQPVGAERLLLRLLDPQAPEGERSRECWAKLPAAERLLEWQVLTLDAQPVLLVTTMPADKLSLFGEKLVRVFPLVADRTRGGAAPLFAVQSGMNLWQPMHPAFRDVDGDGRSDLVLGYWKGLKDSTLVLDSYLREPAGGFRSRAGSQSFDVKGGEHSVLNLDRDLTGDGAPDVVVAAENKLCVHAGAASPGSASAIVSKRPSVCVPMPAGLEDFGELTAAMGSGGFRTDQQGGDTLQEFADLDGDGRYEILLIGLAGSGSDTASGRVSVIRFE